MTLDKAFEILSKSNPVNADYPLIEVGVRFLTVRTPVMIPYELTPGESVEAALDKIVVVKEAEPVSEPSAEGGD